MSEGTSNFVNGFFVVLSFNIFVWLQGFVLVDMYRALDRNLEVRFPFKSYIPFASIAKVVVPSDALSFSVSLPDLNRSWQSIVLKPNGKNCPSQNNALIRKVVPWSHESQYFLTNQSFSLHLHAPKAPADSEYDSVHLQWINPNPQCAFVIEYENVFRFRSFYVYKKRNL